MIGVMDEPWRDHWGRWVKARARFLGKRLGEVAREINVPERTLSRWCASARMPDIRLGAEERLADALNVHPAELPGVNVAWNPESPGFIDASDQVKRAHAEFEKRRAVASLDLTEEQASEFRTREMISEIAYRLYGEDLERLYRFAAMLMGDVVEREAPPEEREFLRTIRPTRKLAAKHEADEKGTPTKKPKGS